jgi:hypothetical protein
VKRSDYLALACLARLVICRICRICRMDDVRHLLHPSTVQYGVHNIGQGMQYIGNPEDDDYTDPELDLPVEQLGTLGCDWVSESLFYRAVVFNSFVVVIVIITIIACISSLLASSPHRLTTPSSHHYCTIFRSLPFAAPILGAIIPWYIRDAYGCSCELSTCARPAHFNRCNLKLGSRQSHQVVKSSSHQPPPPASHPRANVISISRDWCFVKSYRIPTHFCAGGLQELARWLKALSMEFSHGKYKLRAKNNY